MASKRDMKLKQQRRAERLEDKQLHKAATIAVQHSFAIAMYSVKDVFKERASNPKVEAFIVKMMGIWEKIGNTCVGLTMYEMKLCLRKMKQMGWKPCKRNGG